MDFGSAVVGGVPLVLVIAGLVAFAKTMGLAGKWLTALSLLLGTLLGVLYQLSLGPITGFPGWFTACIYGLGLGVTTAGLYDMLKRDVVGPVLASMQADDCADVD